MDKRKNMGPTPKKFLFTEDSYFNSNSILSNFLPLRYKKTGGDRPQYIETVGSDLD